LLVTTLAGASTWGSAAAAQGKSQWDGVFTDEQAKRGNAVYTKECASCHGDALEGMGEAPSLSGGEFAAAWNDLTLNQLFDRIQKTMPQSAPGSLSREQYAEVIAHILQKNGAPAGKTELPSNMTGLGEITYKMNK
jgi:mono/diheme cytochrome c family protein